MNTRDKKSYNVCVIHQNLFTFVIFFLGDGKRVGNFVERVLCKKRGLNKVNLNFLFICFAFLTDKTFYRFKV